MKISNKIFMKKKLFYVLFFIVFNITFHAQIINDFDAGLKKVLIQKAAYWNVKDINGNILSSADINDDGEIDVSEAENVGYLNFNQGAIGNDNFETLNGINYLKNLKGISCDIYTGRSRDTGTVGNINISGLQNLEFIEFGQFFVKSISVENCPKLIRVNSGTNHFYSIGTTDFYIFKNCPLLETVNCIAGNLGALSFENCPALKNIDITGNQLNSIDVSMLPNLEKLYTRNYFDYGMTDVIDFPKNGITSLNLSQNTKLVDLDCSKNSLNTLNFSNNPLLNHINCSKNNLANLDVSNLNLLGGSNEGVGFSSFQPSLDCSDNQLTNLNLTNSNIAGLKCNNNQLTNLTNLDATHLQTLICSNNILTNLDVSNFLGLNYLDCSNNGINNLNVKNVFNLQELYCQHNSLNALNFENNNNLWAIYCNYNNLQELIVPNPAIVVFNNNPNLTYLNIKNGGQDTIENADILEPILNTNLKFICLDDTEDYPIRTFLQNVQSSNLNFNSYCSFVPGGNYNTITGKVRFDENNNGCDESDEIFQHMKLKIDDGTNNGNTFVQNTGDYNFYTQSGNFTVTALPENPDLFSVTPATFSVNFTDNNNNVTTQNICVTKINNTQDLEVVIAPITNARPGFPAKYKLVYRNKGNTNLSGVVKLDFEGNKMSFNNSSIPYSAISTNSITYTFNNLKPFENKSIELEFTINPPTHPTFPVNLNDVLTFTANGNIIGNDILPEDNVFTLKQTVVGSFDPNDITCLEGNEIPETFIGEYLHYLVNFENIGTAEAENIVIEMDINPNDFDVSTLQLINATGEVYTRINGNKAEFIFKKIKLGSGGHGNILLKMRSKSNLTKNDVIINNANVYFDYNFPVKTNDAITQFLNYLNNHEINDKNNIKVYPIPAKDIIIIDSDVAIKSIELYDENGRILKKILNPNKNTNLNIENYSKGNYYLILKSNNEVKTKKLIKE